MLKKKFIRILIAFLLVIGFLPIASNIKPKKKVMSNMKHTRIVKTTLKEVKKQYKQNEKWIMYIGNSLCGDCNDFRENAIFKIIKDNPKIKIYYLDFVKRNKMDGNWNKIIGPKNGHGVKNPILSPSIRNFTFNYTPTILILQGNKALSVWEEFGGGPLRLSRYYRNDESKKEIGYNNAIEDVNKIIKKHFN